jgi:acyl carrier protein
MRNSDFDRLTGCFRQAFPDLPAGEIPGASVESLTAWDSITHITLLNLIQEEFEVEMDLDEFDQATSFSAMLNLIREKSGKPA